jgi:hypothetical protein
MTLMPEVEHALVDAVRRDVVRASTHHQRRGLCWHKVDIGRRGRPLALIALLVVGGATGAVAAAGRSRVPAPVPSGPVATRPVTRAQTPAPAPAPDSRTTPAPRAKPIAPNGSATRPAPRAKPIAPSSSATRSAPRAATPAPAPAPSPA